MELKTDTKARIPIGRMHELGLLSDWLLGEAAQVVHLYGIPGIGKSTLLRAFMEQAAEADFAILRMDCRSIEPTTRGFLAELQTQLGSRARSLSKICEQMGNHSSRVVLVLDSFEHFLLMDAWLRQEFMKYLPDHVSLLIASRLKPSAGWYSLENRGEQIRSIPLGPIMEQDSMQLLKDAGVDEVVAQRIEQSTQGHPLALQLAMAALKERPGLHFEGVAFQGVIEELTHMFLADVPEESTRKILVGVSVLRRITIPLLEAIFPETPAQESYERLAALPFTEATRDGLMLHSVVRDALARSLRARDPQACQRYRRKAWMRLYSDSSGATHSELWRYTADLLYILDNPVGREAFFPTGESWLQVEPAGSQDVSKIGEIIRKHLDFESRTELLNLLEELPGAFSVVRGESLECLGFYVAFDPAEIEESILEADRSTASWLAHLRLNPMPVGQRAFFIRRWLSDEHGEGPSEIQAACWLDIKRSYMEMRPRLQRVYLTVDDPIPYAAVVSELGFTLPPELQLEREGGVRHGAMLDFGAGSVDGWLASLLAAETGMEIESPVLDRESRELIVGERRTDLTRLEFNVLSYLMERPGKAVSRNALLNDVWGINYEGGSNVVDTVVAALRKKLGESSKWIKTISGMGYSYRSPVA